MTRHRSGNQVSSDEVESVVPKDQVARSQPMGINFAAVFAVCNLSHPNLVQLLNAFSTFMRAELSDQGMICMSNIGFCLMLGNTYT